MEGLKMEIIEHTFPSEYKMAQWLSQDANIDELKEKYPPGSHKAKIDLINKQIVITVLKDPNGKENSNSKEPDSIGSQKDLGDART